MGDKYERLGLADKVESSYERLNDSIADYIDSRRVAEEAARVHRQRLLEAHENLRAYSDSLFELYVGDETGKNIEVNGTASLLRYRDSNWYIDQVEVESLQLNTTDVEVPRFNPLLHEDTEQYARTHARIVAQDARQECYYVPVDSDGTTIDIL